MKENGQVSKGESVIHMVKWFRSWRVWEMIKNNFTNQEVTGEFWAWEESHSALNLKLRYWEKKTMRDQCFIIKWATAIWEDNEQNFLFLSLFLTHLVLFSFKNRNLWLLFLPISSCFFANGVSLLDDSAVNKLTKFANLSTITELFKTREQ